MFENGDDVFFFCFFAYKFVIICSRSLAEDLQNVVDSAAPVGVLVFEIWLEIHFSFFIHSSYSSFIVEKQWKKLKILQNSFIHCNAGKFNLKLVVMMEYLLKNRCFIMMPKKKFNWYFSQVTKISTFSTM